MSSFLVWIETFSVKVPDVASPLTCMLYTAVTESLIVYPPPGLLTVPLTGRVPE
ncbi:MAG: hypothetical protein ACLQNE_44770 [Thermoguttaceae bacterium]|jgi:hypothetical protein